MRDQNKLAAYKREWMRQRRAEYFAGKICVDCGSTEDLELDHVVPDNKVTHAIWSWAKERRDAELAKCAPRCRGCHKKKSIRESAERAKPLTHGTFRGYRNGCRCSLCGEARLAYRQGLISASEVYTQTPRATNSATEDLRIWGEFPVGFKPSRKLLKQMNLVPGARFELARGA
jgi:hypothetical protein